MDCSVIENIKKSFISYFNASKKKEIELLFDSITIILWKLSNNGEMKFIYDNKETQYSQMLKKYLMENWNDIVPNGMAGFSLPKAKEPIVFANGESNVMIAVLIHEIFHQLLGKN